MATYFNTKVTIECFRIGYEDPRLRTVLCASSLAILEVGDNLLGMLCGSQSIRHGNGYATTGVGVETDSKTEKNCLLLTFLKDGNLSVDRNFPPLQPNAKLAQVGP